MNRSELVDSIADHVGLSKREADAALSAIVYEVTKSVRSGETVQITGFGSFKLRERRARTGRNPRTGEAVKVKASKGIGFTPGATLKADVNSK